MYMDTDPLLKPSTNKSGGNKLEQTAHHTNWGNYVKNNIYNKPITTLYLSMDDPVVGEETERNAVPDEGVLHLWRGVLSYSTFSRVIYQNGRDRLRGSTQPKSSA